MVSKASNKEGQGPDIARTIVSRRDRPAKPPLSREIVVATALDILKTEGPQKLTLREIAKKLDTGPASLYVYVPNLRRLQELMFDEGLRGISRKRTQNGWRFDLIKYLQAYMHALIDKPGLARIALAIMPHEAHYLGVIEHILALLKEGGVSDKKAAWGVDMLLLYATAIAAEQGLREGAEPFNEAKKAFDLLHETQFPVIAAIRPVLFSGGSSRSAWAMAVIIEGILVGPSPDDYEEAE